MDLPYLKGQRIGTYLFSEIVKFIKQWPDAIINPIFLSGAHATKENKPRRNNMYENAGLIFDYDEPAELKLGGVSRPMPAKNLKIVTTWNYNVVDENGKRGNMRELPAIEFYKAILKSHQDTVKLSEQYKNALNYYESLYKKAKKNPLWWGLKNSTKDLFDYLLTSKIGLSFMAIVMIALIILRFN